MKRGFILPLVLSVPRLTDLRGDYAPSLEEMCCMLAQVMCNDIIRAPCCSYDDWIAEFAWSSPPPAGAVTVQSDRLTSSFDGNCHCPGNPAPGYPCPPEEYPHNPCFLYTAKVGGWRSYAGSGNLPPGAMSSSVSQGWRQLRCTGTLMCRPALFTALSGMNTPIGAWFTSV